MRTKKSADPITNPAAPIDLLKEAIARGEEKRKQALQETEKAAELSKKKKEEENARYEAEVIAKYRLWIANDLLKIIEEYTSWGYRNIELRQVAKHGCVEILAKLCQEAGFTIVIKEHDVAYSCDDGYRQEAYSYFTYTLTW